MTTTSTAITAPIAAETRPVWDAANDRRRFGAISAPDAAAQIAAFRSYGLDAAADEFAAQWEAAR